MNGNHSDQVDLIDIAEWRKAIQEARLHLEAEAKSLTERLEATHAELNRIQNEAALIEQVTRAYPARIQTPPKHTLLAGNNLREVLIIHFANPDGIILGKHATTTLYNTGYFSNRRSADGAVYTTLGKPPFIKVSKGVYRIPTDSPDWLRLRASTMGTNGHVVPVALTKVEATQSPLVARQSTGLVDKVEEILKGHPNWEAPQIHDELEKERWDFGGKKPMSAITMAIANLSKHGRRPVIGQVPLPV